jgi:hypothetical protein
MSRNDSVSPSAIGRTRRIFAAVGHLDGDAVIIRVDTGLRQRGFPWLRLVPTSLEPRRMADQGRAGRPLYRPDEGWISAAK